MGTIRKGGSPNSGYTKLPNELIRNLKISDGTFRFISWVQSHVDGFHVSFTSIKSSLGYGREKLRSIINEAEENNYLVRVKIQDTKGRYDWDYHVFAEVSECKLFKLERGIDNNHPGGVNPSVVQPSVVQPVGGSTVGGYNPPHKKNIKSKDQKKKNQGESSDLAQVEVEIVEPPETAKPETEKPETVQPETVQPETVQPETVQPETANPVHIKYLSQEVINQELSREEVFIPPNPRNQNGKREEGKSQPIEVEIFESESVLQQTPKSLPHTHNPSLWQKSPAPLVDTETVADRVRRTWQETGILPRIPAELEAWVQTDLGTEIIALYRKSGRVTTTKQGDIHPDFARYVSAQNKGKDIDYGYSYIRSLEKDPTKWETLASLIIKWQASKATNNHSLNITQEVERTSKPKIDFSGVRL